MAAAGSAPRPERPRMGAVSPEEMRRWVAESRQFQGLPPTIEDPETLDRYAVLIASALTRANLAQAA